MAAGGTAVAIFLAVSIQMPWSAELKNLIATPEARLFQPGPWTVRQKLPFSFQQVAHFFAESLSQEPTEVRSDRG